MNLRCVIQCTARYMYHTFRQTFMQIIMIIVIEYFSAYYIIDFIWSDFVIKPDMYMRTDGNPYFCFSTEYIQQHKPCWTWNVQPMPIGGLMYSWIWIWICYTVKSISHFSFCLKTRTVISCLSTCHCPGINSCCISSQARFHVNVMNRSEHTWIIVLMRISRLKL